MKSPNFYRSQVQLLIQALPVVATQMCFALKGGTAINLFLRDLPRLSVDIDLTYVPIKPRTDSLKEIETALANIEQAITRTIPKTSVRQTSPNKIIVRKNNIQIKIETSPVLRGAVHEPSVQTVSDTTEQEFGYAQIQLLGFEDIYAGKICAALDRQHPRDLFDIKHLLDTDGISRNLFETFLVYLISHNRPINEVLVPSLSDISSVFDTEFANMTMEATTLGELTDARNQLIAQIHQHFTEKDRKFLLEFKSGTPDWSLLDLPGIDKLPAVQWKLQNLAKMPRQNHAKALEELERKLGEISDKSN